ncbi:amino acid ABC transporter substrate-binding protein, PAAT family [Faunimonas pinastri]|uniref:Amino acid ABC transporter substrate-binding protein, PAAT family n=1 Tax=Faunimonas pinastri TaxID=1855383 RepID=A0A1H9E8R0_9HYPH|nr:transporter substrate-binding domain-containing protein [Faunimonas pinastri]SEQ22110.1 amino acid ABC transporter substrate-binding protein, PAAT family [Faunimonas pinastri]
MIRRLAVALALTCSALVSLPARAADFQSALLVPGVISIGTTGSAPPTSMIDQSGALAGYDVDVMNKVAADLGAKAKFVQLDWSGLLPGLAAHRFDVVASGVTRTGERLKSKQFIMLSPYIINGVAITKLASNSDIKGWDDVCGKRMGTVRGASEGKAIQAMLPKGCISKVVEYPGWTELTLDLKNHRIDWIGMDYLGPSYEASRDHTLVTLPDVRERATQSIAVSSAEPELAKAIDALLAKYRKDGTLSAMVQKWFGQKVDFANLPADPKG